MQSILQIRRDESLLCQGLALNDDLERVLAKYESVVSGSSVEAEKSSPEPAAGDLVNVDTPGQHVDAGESNKQANERSNSALVPVSAAPPANGSVPTPTMDLLSGDLGGDFYGSPTQNSLALVPVSVTQPANPVGSENNALALADMLSAGSSAPTNTNGPQPAYEYQNQQPNTNQDANDDVSSPSPMTTPVYPPQPIMYGSQMAAGYGYHMAGGYGNQMAAGYGYGRYEPQQHFDQRMYGLSSGTSTSSQPSSYLPPMKQSKGGGDDKLFGDLVDMAKIKPTNNPPAATTGGTI